MSQSLFSQAMDSPQPLGYDPSTNTEFNYRPVPVLAPLSLCLGLLSALGFLGLLVVPIGFVGVLVSLVCIVRLRKFRGEYGGMWLAVAGLLMSLVFFTTSAGLWAYGYQTEVPKGFKRLNFMSDISRKGFVVAKGKADIFNPDVKALDGQKVFIKGYMYPTKQIQGLRTFLLVKDNAQCCFGGNPAMQDMILVNLEGGKTVNFHQGLLISIGGVFHCQPGSGPAGLQPVYTIDGMFVENSRTMFRFDGRRPFRVVPPPELEPTMDTFGKAAWMLLVAACACLAAAGCWKTSAERFETYNELKKSAVERPAERESAQKAEAGQRLTSTPDDARPTSARPETNVVAVTKTATAAPVAKAGRPAAQQESRPKVESGPKVKTASAAVPASFAKSLPKSPAASATSPLQPGARPNGAGGTAGAFQASVASSVPGGPVSRPSAPRSGRKVQLLVPQRTFRTEGPEGAWRVSYNDIDLLKVLNMDPVPADAATQMPGWLKGLEGKRIRIRGFMYPTFQQTGVHAFGLARDNQICCFGRNPKIYDVFDVLLREGVTTDYLPNRPFDVVGVFHIRPEAEDGKLYHLYEIDDATVIIK